MGIMSLEIRRVPADWVHPQGSNGEFLPLHNQDIKSAMRDWKDQEAAWLEGRHPDQHRYEDINQYSFREWHGDPPDPIYYRTRRWTEADATAYQIYETITEGTPLSPVLIDNNQVIAWLLENGYSTDDVQILITSGRLVPQVLMTT